MSYWVYIYTYGDNVTYDSMHAPDELEAKKQALLEISIMNRRDAIGRKLLDIVEVTTGYSYLTFEDWQRRSR